MVQFIKQTFAQKKLKHILGILQNINRHFSGIAQKINMHFLDIFQVLEMKILKTPKKRKLNFIGHFKGSFNKAKLLNKIIAFNSSILDFNFFFS